MIATFLFFVTVHLLRPLIPCLLMCFDVPFLFLWRSEAFIFWSFLLYFTKF